MTQEETAGATPGPENHENVALKDETDLDEHDTEEGDLDDEDDLDEHDAEEHKEDEEPDAKTVATPTFTAATAEIGKPVVEETAVKPAVAAAPKTNEELLRDAAAEIERLAAALAAATVRERKLLAELESATLSIQQGVAAAVAETVVGLINREVEAKEKASGGRAARSQAPRPADKPKTRGKAKAQKPKPAEKVRGKPGPKPKGKPGPKPKSGKR